MSRVHAFPKGQKSPLSEHFSTHEFDCPCGECTETLVDLDLIVVLEHLRRVMGGKPVTISSGYRCVPHNGTIPNADPNSYHTKGMAADIKIGGADPTEMLAHAVKCGATGVGLYHNRIHVDVRVLTDAHDVAFWRG